jgi:protein-disulfide isomerase
MRYLSIPTRGCCGYLPLVLSFALLSVGCLPAALAQSVQTITDAGQKEMLSDPGTDIDGAADADVQIIEFFDYNCPYCKKMAPVFRSLLAEDRKTAIVYKEWPIFGDVSVYAAKSALGARWQGKYLVAHHALMDAADLSDDQQVDAVLKRAGIDVVKLKKDRASHAAQIDALLQRNNAEAHALHLRGTPGIVVGRQLLPGTVDLQGLKQLVAGSRRMR